MIKWWRPETIEMSSKLWKPGLEPLYSEPYPIRSWFHSNMDHFVDVQTPATAPTLPHLPDQSYQHPYAPSPTQYVKPLMRSRKIKLNPDKEQRAQLNKMWDAYRFTYNKTIEAIIADVINPEENTFKLLCQLSCQGDSVKLDFGSELEPNRDIKVRLKVDCREPEVALVVEKKEKKQTKKEIAAGKPVEEFYKTKVKVVHDPSRRPLKLELGFEYPPPRHWHDYRDELVTGDAVRAQNWYQDAPHLLETNKYIRQGAVQQAVSAYKSVMGNAKNNGTKGSLRTLFQKKKNESWSMHLDRLCVSKTTVTVTRKKINPQKPEKKTKDLDAISLCPMTIKTPIKCWEKFGPLEHDPKIHKDKWGDYWLIVPFKVTPKQNTSNKPSVALDCGEKTFVTGYTTDGDVVNHGTGVRDKWRPIMKKIHGLQSMLDRKLFHGRAIKYAKATIAKEWHRLVHMKDDMHWKLANQLTRDYNLIVRGKFNVKGILRGAISKQVKEVLQQQGHFQFKQRLMSKAEERNVKVKEWSEWGTTVGCPCCGHRTSVTDRTFRCSHCQYTADRDDKAGCCIMLKYLAGVW